MSVRYFICPIVLRLIVFITPQVDFKCLPTISLYVNRKMELFLKYLKK